MTHVTALRNSVLCGFAVVAVAGCGAASLTRDPVPAVAGAGAPTGGASPSPVATPPTGSDTSGINQQINGINSQLSTIDGQLNVAGAGLSTSEGDPSQ
jgi:hypothetical protein